MEFPNSNIGSGYLVVAIHTSISFILNKMKEKNKIKFGECPHCKSEDYEQTFSEFQNAYSVSAPYVVIECYCNKCEGSWTEYYTQDEIKYDDKDNNDFCLGNTLSKDDKEVLLEAMNLLIEQEGDTTDRTRILTILKGGLVNQG